MKVKPGVRVPAVVSGFVTTIFTVPTVCAGVVAVIVLAFMTLTFVAATPPIVTVAPFWKFAPVIVTFVPPATLPVVGDTAVRLGGGGTTVIVPCMAARSE